MTVISVVLSDKERLIALFNKLNEAWCYLLEVILCLFEYFGCQNIRKETTGRLNVGKDATSIKFSSVLVALYIN